jgi:hypothetical protein
LGKYLGSGFIKGIGPHFAKKLVQTFGRQIFDVIEHEPARLTEVPGIGPTRKERITKSWRDRRIVWEIMVFLQSHGVGTARAVRIYKTYGGGRGGAAERAAGPAGGGMSANARNSLPAPGYNASKQSPPVSVQAINGGVLMAALVSRPVRRMRSVGYPTKFEVLAHPEVLARHVPPGWLARREIAGAVGVFLAANAAGCGDRTTGSAPGGPGQDPRLEKVALVAPIFEHGRGQGEGRFSLSCVAVAAPTYLPEEEALRVIGEELARAGLQMSERHVELRSVIIAGREFHRGYEWISGQRAGFTPVKGPLELDLRDPVRHVAVEYVCTDNFDRLGGHDENQWSMDIKGVAASVAGEVRKQGHGLYFGAFYDPVEYYGYGGWARLNDEDGSGFHYEASEPEALTESQRLLRQQVRDFVDWLKAQGAI